MNICLYAVENLNLLLTLLIEFSVSTVSDLVYDDLFSVFCFLALLYCIIKKIFYNQTPLHLTNIFYLMLQIKTYEF